jgi:hypothetical protein
VTLKAVAEGQDEQAARALNASLAKASFQVDQDQAWLTARRSLEAGALRGAVNDFRKRRDHGLRR